MTASPRSPKLIKGGIVLMDSASGVVLRVIALQYNPHSLTRSLQAQWYEPQQGGDRAERLRIKGAARRDDQAGGGDRRDRWAGAAGTESGDRRVWDSNAARGPRNARLSDIGSAQREQQSSFSREVGWRGCPDAALNVLGDGGSSGLSPFPYSVDLVLWLCPQKLLPVAQTLFVTFHSSFRKQR